MINLIAEQWNVGFWSKIYVLFFIFVVICLLAYIPPSISKNPLRSLKHIEQAYNNKCIAIGKLVCASLHGVGHAQYELVEYLYYVDKKPYYVTYRFNLEEDYKDIDMTKINPDELTQPIKTTVALFYNKRNPKKVISKIEVFCSNSALHQVKTLKTNIYRDTEKHWTEEINLVTYK